MSPSSGDAEVVMFLSADVVGSTDFKARNAADSSEWLEAFATLFRELPLIFIGELAMAFMSDDAMPPEAGVWKVMGDEVIFVALPADAGQAARVAAAFIHTVSSYDRKLAARWPLRIRGTCWAAELGQRNRRIDIPEMFGGRDGEPYRDFLGPDIDIGFRLSSHAGQGEVILSPNLVEAIAGSDDADLLRLHPIEPRSLKGVIGGHPFPLIMASTPELASSRPVVDAETLALQLGALRQQLAAQDVAMAGPAFAGRAN